MPRLSAEPAFDPNDNAPPALVRARAAWVAAHVLLHGASDDENQYLNVARLVRPLFNVAVSTGRSDAAEELGRFVQALEGYSALMVIAGASFTDGERMNRGAKSVQAAARSVVESWLRELGAWVGVDPKAIKDTVPVAPLPVYEWARQEPRQCSKARSLWDEYRLFILYGDESDDLQVSRASGVARQLADIAAHAQRPDLVAIFGTLAGDGDLLFEGVRRRLAEAHRDDIEELLLEEDELARAPKAAGHSARAGGARSRRGA